MSFLEHFLKEITVSRLLIIFSLFYVGYSSWSFWEVFRHVDCRREVSQVKPLWAPKSELSVQLSYRDNEAVPEHEIVKTTTFTLADGIEITVNTTVPPIVFRNGSTVGQLKLSFSHPFYDMSVPLTSYRDPTRTAFNLLSKNSNATARGSESEEKKVNSHDPVTFWLTHLYVYVLETPVVFCHDAVPPEMFHLLRIHSRASEVFYDPIIYVNPKLQAFADWMEVPKTPEKKELPITLSVVPLSIGQFRLRCMLEIAAQQMRGFGLKDKDINEVRGILVDTNLYLLLTTVFVSVFHILFDFLAFKNDISFWRSTENTAGLSFRTVVWRFFSSVVIFLHLWEERASLLVLVPIGVSAVIEFWKLTRIMKLKFSFRTGFQLGVQSAAEKETDAIDAQFMRWLFLLIIPLCIAGSVYSLLYTHHRSWYSWCLQTMVNGVYAFGFLLMTPQLFLNYRLKSVAHLPWKTMTYKAFNTFIDDFFAFIIAMPTMHRIACLRDDAIFVIFLYQRWLYPVDKSRVNEFGQSFKEESVLAPSDKKHD